MLPEHTNWRVPKRDVHIIHRREGSLLLVGKVRPLGREDADMETPSGTKGKPNRDSKGKPKRPPKHGPPAKRELIAGQDTVGEKLLHNVKEISRHLIQLGQCTPYISGVGKSRRGTQKLTFKMDSPA